MTDIIENDYEFLYKNDKYEILTDTGFQDFDGLLESNNNTILEITFNDDNVLKCTLGHKIYLNKTDFVLAKDLKLNQSVVIDNKEIKIVDIKLHTFENDIQVFDILDAKNGNKFYLTNNEKPYILCGNSVYIDEMAFIQNAEEFFASTMPVISSGDTSQLIITSCVTDDTYVYTMSGIKQVKDFINYKKPNNPNIGYITSIYDVDGYEDINYGNIMVNNGYVDTLKIKTKYTELECSLNHKILADIIDNTPIWKEAKDLKINDTIYLKIGNNLWGNNDYIFLKDVEQFNWDDTIELEKYKKAFLLGQYLVSNNTTLTDEYLMLPYNEFCKEYFIDFNFSHHFDKADMFIKTHNKHILSLFNLLNLQKNKIGEHLLLCSKNVILMIIKGIYSIIGNITNNNKIYFKTTNIELLHQIRIILINVGICSILQSNNEKYFSLFIDDNDAPLFINSIINCCSTRINELKYFEPIYKKIKINNIEKSQNYVYDFSLNHNKNDMWCHSIIYNGIVGHQTPNGLNLFHKLYSEAEEGINGMKSLKYLWDANPLRDEKWKQENLGILGEKRFRIEMESCSYDTIVNIDGEDIQIGKLYEIMKNT